MRIQCVNGIQTSNVIFMYKIRILLVEDSFFSQKVAKTVLEGLNCQVDIVSTGEESIALAQKNHYDLMLIDIGLPGIDGIMAAKLIRDQEKTDHPTPIIALTSQDDPALKTEAIAAGMSDYLVKPLTRFSAEEILSRYCNQMSSNFSKSRGSDSSTTIISC